MTKTKKTILISAVGILMITIMGSAFVLSTTACSFSPGSKRFGFHHRGMPPFAKEEIKEFILWRMDKTAADLNLTTAQNEAWDTFKTSLLTSFNAGIQQRDEIRQLARSQFEKDSIDALVLTESVRQHIQDISGMLDTNLSFFNDFYTSLDPDQKTRISEMIKEKINRHHQLETR